MCRSDSALGFGTLASRCAPLVLLPWHPRAGSRSSAQQPVSGSRPLYAGRRPPGHQAPGGLIPEMWTASGFDGAYGYRRVVEGLLPLGFRTPTCPRSIPGLLIRRSPPRLLTAAARTGLRPAPESRSRWAYHHLLRSFTPRFSVQFMLNSFPCLCGTRPHFPRAPIRTAALRPHLIFERREPQRVVALPASQRRASVLPSVRPVKNPLEARQRMARVKRARMSGESAVRSRRAYVLAFGAIFDKAKEPQMAQRLGYSELTTGTQ